MENIFSNIQLLKIIVKWRILLICVLILSAGLSFLFSGPWFIKPKYKSTAIVYPSNLIPYSSESPTELMIQLFQSTDIRDSLIAKFNLADHYNIKKTDSYITNLTEEYNSNVSVKKNEYEAVVIEVMDCDKNIAYKMVNEIIRLFNKKVRKLQREKSREVLIIAENQLLQKRKQIDSLQEKLNFLRSKFEILDYDLQTKEVYRSYYKSAAAGNTSVLQKPINNLKEKGGEYVLLKDLFSGATSTYNQLKVEYEIALRDVNKELSYTNIVSSPFAADKKSYPVRWLIVLIATAAALTFTFIMILFIENVRKPEITNA